MVKLRAFIFGTVMHLYWGYLQGRNYASINNIHKVTNILKISHFALFGSFGIHVKDTNFTFGTPHTHIYTDTHRHMQTYRHRYVNVHVGNLRKLLPEVCGSIHSECQSQHKQ